MPMSLPVLSQQRNPASLVGAGERNPLRSQLDPLFSAWDDLFDWYVAEGWLVDRAQRKLELARGALASYGDLFVPSKR